MIGIPAPQWGEQPPCGSGFTREAGDAVHGTGYAGVRGHGRSHKHSVSPALRRPCGSGQAREAGDAVDGTGCAGVRG
ncbi:hypothetical protein C6A77_09030 [Pseudomonas sp. AFG_SD02_1510_Pfu_092]|nr:hypothetical protein C6A77_09030 [Pseudomonas sp. AFG_SD02_1510_Pfu_092]